MTSSNPSPGHAPGLPADTPVLALYREIRALISVFDDLNVTRSEEEAQRLYAKITGTKWRLTREPATCAADVAAKVLQLTQVRDEPDAIFVPELVAELESFLAGLA